MDDMQTSAQEWIQKNSFRARQQGTVAVPKTIPAPVVEASPAAAPEPEAVNCESGVSQKTPGGYFRYTDDEGRSLGEIAANSGETPSGFFRYYDTNGEAVRIRIPEERLQNAKLPVTVKEWIEAENEKIVTGQTRIHEALAEVVVGDPEGLASMRRRCERLEDELKESYKEIAAMRRATAGVGKPAGRKFFESLGQGLEMDADGLLDLLDEHGEELPEAVVSYLKTFARNLSNFALNAMAYSQTI